MLQIRGREGDDKRWYCPDRDVVYAFPRIFRKSLEAFNDFKGDDKASLEQLCEACRVFARVVNGCREGGVPPSDIRKMLEGIHAESFDKVARVFLFTFFGEFVIWCSDARPKAPGDAPLGLEEIEELIERFAKAARHGGACDEKTSS
jgi:hypothetical protein